MKGQVKGAGLSLPCLFESWAVCENRPDDTAPGQEARDNTKGAGLKH